jgi:hypothetical protein
MDGETTANLREREREREADDRFALTSSSPVEVAVLRLAGRVFAELAGNASALPQGWLEVAGEIKRGGLAATVVLGGEKVAAVELDPHRDVLVLQETGSSFEVFLTNAVGSLLPHIVAAGSVARHTPASRVPSSLLSGSTSGRRRSARLAGSTSPPLSSSLSLLRTPGAPEREREREREREGERRLSAGEETPTMASPPRGMFLLSPSDDPSALDRHLADFTAPLGEIAGEEEERERERERERG